MTSETADAGGLDEARTTESTLLKGLVAALSASGGPLDDSAIDEALGISRAVALPSVEADGEQIG